MRCLFGCPDIVSLTEKFLMARIFFSRIFTENNPVMGDSKTLCIPEAKGLTIFLKTFHCFRMLVPFPKYLPKLSIFSQYIFSRFGKISYYFPKRFKTFLKHHIKCNLTISMSTMLYAQNTHTHVCKVQVLCSPADLPVCNCIFLRPWRSAARILRVTCTSWMAQSHCFWRQCRHGLRVHTWVTMYTLCIRLDHFTLIINTWHHVLKWNVLKWNVFKYMYLNYVLYMYMYMYMYMYIMLSMYMYM